MLLLSLDEEKAFDKVHFEFLFAASQKFGFGESFVNWQLIYNINMSILLTALTIAKNCNLNITQWKNLLIYYISMEKASASLNHDTADSIKKMGHNNQ